jgi:proteic killer suppression protein
MIRSFKDKDTETIFNGRFVRRIPKQVALLAARKLNQVHAAGSLDDLRIPTGNRLEALKGDRKGQHSIRINDQWRICFRWTTAGPDAVEIVDYH